MTRRKVKLAFIVNPSDRKASYKKRKRGLMKKVQELSTLCGIEAAAILYGPYDENPEVWPEDPAALNQVLMRFKQVPPSEKGKRMVNQEVFTQKRIEKLKDQIKKVLGDNREKEVGYFITKCLEGEQIPESLQPPDAKDVEFVLQRNIKEITRRIAYLKNGPGGSDGGAAPQVGGGPGSHHQVVDLPPPPPPPFSSAGMSMMTLLTHPEIGGGIGDGGVGSSSVVAALPPPPPHVATEMMTMNTDYYHHYNLMQSYGYLDVGWPHNNPYQQQMMAQPSSFNYHTNAGSSHGGGAGSSSRGGGGGAGPSYMNTTGFDLNYFNMNNNNNGAGGSGFGGAGVP